MKKRRKNQKMSKFLIKALTLALLVTTIAAAVPCIMADGAILVLMWYLLALFIPHIFAVITHVSILGTLSALLYNWGGHWSEVCPPWQT